MADGYRGIVGAYPYALLASRSLLFKTWVLASALATLLIGGFVTLGIVFLIGQTAGIAGGSLTLSRAFYVVVGLFVVAPVVAPTLLVARRHRRAKTGDGDDSAGDGAAEPSAAPAPSATYDRLLALSGFAFLLLLYVGLVVTVPADQQQPVSPGVWAPLIRYLYSLPQLAGLVPPAAGAVLVYLAHRVGR
jgi:hypothetical protein